MTINESYLYLKELEDAESDLFHVFTEEGIDEDDLQELLEELPNGHIPSKYLSFLEQTTSIVVMGYVALSFENFHFSTSGKTPFPSALLVMEFGRSNDLYIDICPENGNWLSAWLFNPKKAFFFRWSSSLDTLLSDVIQHMPELDDYNDLLPRRMKKMQNVKPLTQKEASRSDDKLLSGFAKSLLGSHLIYDLRNAGEFCGFTWDEEQNPTFVRHPSEEIWALGLSSKKTFFGRFF